MDAGALPEITVAFVGSAPVSLQRVVQQSADDGARRIASWFPSPSCPVLHVIVYEDRDRLVAHWRERWDMPTADVPCWMVGETSGTTVELLSPLGWGEGVCDHRPGDMDSFSEMVRHELVHACHHQRMGVDPPPDLQ